LVKVCLADPSGSTV